MPLPITIRDLCKTFASPRGDVPAVANVTLDIAPGELFFLLGPSGCGKTTLLRMIAGFIDPTSGAIRFADRDVTHTAPNKRNTAMVFQSYALWPHMTVEQNVAFGLTVRKVPADQRTARVRDALESVHLADLARRKPNELSGGQQQRVALARALVIRPDVLLLDEPLSNLDARLRIELRAQIRSICKASGITSIYVTHDQKEALSMADRIAIMRDGVVVQVGTPQDLYRRPRTRFVAEFLGETNILRATVERAADSTATLRIADRFIEARATTPPTPGARVTCSIRPEALRIAPGPSPHALTATFVSSTYLGEFAQHELALPDGARITAAEINPVPTPHAATVSLSVAPDDVVILDD